MSDDDNRDLTATGIPIGHRYESVMAIPEDVRPVVVASPWTKFPKQGPGDKGPGPRRGRDAKTSWCRSCETAVKLETTTWCPDCKRKRDSAARRVSRNEAAGRPTTITLPLDTYNRLIDLTHDVIAKISEATMEFDRPLMNGGAIDKLMLSTKDLARFVSGEVEPQARTGPTRNDSNG